MLDTDKLNEYAGSVLDIYEKLETSIFEEITKTLSSGVYDDDAFKWQVDKMNQLSKINRKTVEQLADVTDLAEKEIWETIESVADATIDDVDGEIEELLDENLPPFEQVTEILESYAHQTFRDFENYINETLITENMQSSSVAKIYREIINDTTAKVATGYTTIDDAIVETVNKWHRSGLETSFVDKGGNTWGLERYARTSIRSTVNNVYNDMRMRRMDEFDLHLVLVTSLPDPREICSHIQGKVATTKEPNDNDSNYPSIYEYGYGTAGGLRGINCRHQFIPFVEGVNINNQPEYSEKEMIENREQRQKKRYYERQVRQGKKDLQMAQANGSKKQIDKYTARLNEKEGKLVQFIDNHGMTRQLDRERVL